MNFLVRHFIRKFQNEKLKVLFYGDLNTKLKKKDSCYNVNVPCNDFYNFDI